jgi:alpha-beta hydrolase superfamily lysophospholipase
MPMTTCSFANDRGEQLAARRVSRELADRGIAVLSYDFAGLGSSEGDFAATTFSSDVDDLVAAARHLTDTVRSPSLLVGHSSGGAAVLMAAARLPGIEAVATVGAPADVSHVRWHPGRGVTRGSPTTLTSQGYRGVRYVVSHRSSR